MDYCMGFTIKWQLNNRYHTILRLVLFLMIGISLDSVNASPLNQLSNSLMAPIDQSNRYSQRFHYKTLLPTISDDIFDGYHLKTNNINGDEDNDDNNDFGDRSGSFGSKDSKVYSSRGPQHPYKMVKKALSLFAHWKPSLYTSSEDNQINSDVVSAVARGHSRPIGGPLRWGRR